MKEYRVLKDIAFLEDSLIKKGEIVSYSKLAKYYLDRGIRSQEESGFIKEVKRVEVSDMIQGEIYTFEFICLEGIQKCIFKFRRRVTYQEERSASCVALFCNYSKKLEKDHFIDHVNMQMLYAATPEDIEWFERCEKAGKYVDKEYNIPMKLGKTYKIDLSKGGLSNADKQEGNIYTFNLDNPCIKETKKSKLINSIKEKISKLGNKRQNKTCFNNIYIIDDKIKIEEAKLLLVENNQYPIKKKGVNYWLNKLPLNVNGYTFNMNRYKDGYGISYWRCAKVDLISSHSKSFKKALKLMYKKLKKEGYIR